MGLRAFFGALCVFLALLASPVGTAETGERLAVVVGAAPSAPVPAVAHGREPVLPDGVSVARQCTGSTILSRVVDADGTRVFHARFSGEAFDEMVQQGCTHIRQGCNACVVRYTGCTEEQRAACTDGDCLARICKRQTICTSKHCTAQGTKAPPCKARFAIHACEATAFDPLDKGGTPGE